MRLSTLAMIAVLFGIAEATTSHPAPEKGTVGSASQNLPVQQQDSSNVKGLPGNKSGPTAKR